MITFGNIKELSEEDIEIEKKNFYELKLDILCHLLYGPGPQSKSLMTKEDISNLDNLLKIKLVPKENDKGKQYFERKCFLYKFGLSYEFLDDDEKDKLSTMEYSYENFKIFVSKNYKRLTEDFKKKCRSNIWICFEDKCFIAYCQFNEIEINERNLTNFIKDYFILNKEDKRYGKYRENKTFEKIRQEIIYVYPSLKDEYGRNRYLDKFLSFLEPDNDYNYKFLRNLLDDYYKKKSDEKKEYYKENKYLPLKQNED